MSVRLTKKRLEIIIDALAYWETMIDDEDCHLWETEAEFQRLQHDCIQAQVWAHQQLAKRKARKASSF